MLNMLWGFMILIGIVTGILTNNIGAAGNGSIEAAKEAVDLCITMLGVLSLWTGLMEIAKSSGMISGLTKKLMPIIHFLFPGIPKNHLANEYIASNLLANLLGLGWAATPFGLKAMKELETIRKEEIRRSGKKDTHKASNDMCTFLIINISSLQLIPVNIIAYRSQYGSSNPGSIIMPAIAATTISTIAGILFSVLARKISSHTIFSGFFLF
jgi:spore maturation protein A